MGHVIKLPTNWNKLNTERRLIPEGWYSVQVEDMKEKDDGDIEATLSVLDDGEYLGWTIYETFSADNDNGTRAFKRFLEVLGIETNGLEVDIYLCKNMNLRVRIRHKTDDNGKVWANVVAHAPDRQ